jgi:hypothetical protein
MPSAAELHTRDHDGPVSLAGQVDTVSAHSADTAHQQSPTTSGPDGHVGRIVAGSLISGVVAALALVFVPFAGAQEHIITAAVLLAFAFAWGMLALLSERWTSQPQRWVIALLALMGVVGTGILFWPHRQRARLGVAADAGALVIWMTVRTTEPAQPNQGLVLPVFAGLLLSTGGAYETGIGDWNDAGPSDRRRPQAAPELFGIGQPHRRARTRTGRTVDGDGMDRTRRRHHDQGVRLRPRRARLERIRLRSPRRGPGGD